MAIPTTLSVTELAGLLDFANKKCDDYQAYCQQIIDAYGRLAAANKEYDRLAGDLNVKLTNATDMLNKAHAAFDKVFEDRNRVTKERDEALRKLADPKTVDHRGKSVYLITLPTFDIVLGDNQLYVVASNLAEAAAKYPMATEVTRVGVAG